MPQRLILASASQTRADLLTQARVAHDVVVPRIDEAMIKEALLADDAKPRDIADTLAELKAQKVSSAHPGALVIGCDQVLDHRGAILTKPGDPKQAVEQLRALSDDRHMLLSAAVICEDGKPVWRHIGQVRLQMRKLSDGYIEEYVARNWGSIRYAVGCYKLEEEGARLFSAIEGDYFHVLGMPFLELMNHLSLRGDLPT